MWTSFVPLPYRIAIIAALFAAAGGFGWVKGAGHVRAEWSAADAKRIHAEDQAIATRAQANAAIALQQRDINDAITKANHEELTPVLASIAADRVRVGPALCGGPTATAQAQSTSSGDAADPTGWLVSPELESRIRELEERVETALATGRACQAFVRENGMAPVSE